MAMTTDDWAPSFIILGVLFTVFAFIAVMEIWGCHG